MEKYQPIIGLEVHVELKTQSKMFCQCEADYFSKRPNTQTCPVCLGLPGALPVPNRKAVERTILIGKALNCQINSVSKFDRKHYFYPDLPKGYQISQYDQPIAIKGIFVIPSEARNLAKRNTTFGLDPSVTTFPQDDKIRKTFRIRRVHLEEDTGKLIHFGGETLIDFNRSGVPLVEIVTEPDFDNSDDVKRFLEELQVLIRYLSVSDCDMEKGTMRLEPNISVWQVKSHPPNRRTKVKSELPNYKVEIKNINSFRFVKQAIDYEVKRQIGLLERGEKPHQETRGFDEKRGVTYGQRTKEEAHDYRYFPEPDIPRMAFSKQYIKEVEKQLPELPQQKIERYVSQFGIKYRDAYILTKEKKIAEYFEKIISKIKDQRSKLHIKYQKYEQIIANFIVNKKISVNLPIEEFVNKVLEILAPKEVNKSLFGSTIIRIIGLNKKAVEDYKKGKQNAIMFLVGQVMKEMKGQADPKIVREKIEEVLK